MNKRIPLIAILSITIIVLSITCVESSVFGAKDDEISYNPKIKIQPESWDFGEVEGKERKTHVFKVKNTGTGELIIEDVTTSCVCTIASISRKNLLPGENAELEVKFDPKLTGAYGEIIKNVSIKSNDPDQPIKSIQIQLVLKKSLKSESVKISSSELYSRIQSGENLIILDVREENEYTERHMPNAVWFPKSKFDRSEQEVLEKLYNIDKETPVIVYCGAGHRSSYVAEKLKEQGYNTFNLDGISFWEKEGFPLIKGPKSAPSKEPLIIHLKEAYENYYLLFKDIVWIDVRNNEDYKRSHIKRALGIPLSEIEMQLDEIPRDKEIVLYCEGTWDGGTCEASRSAGRILIEKGFKQGKIKVFEEGFNIWKNAGYPIESEGGIKL